MERALAMMVDTKIDSSRATSQSDKVVDVEKAPVKSDDAYQLLTYFPHTSPPTPEAASHSQLKHW